MRRFALESTSGNSITRDSISSLNSPPQEKKRRCEAQISIPGDFDSTDSNRESVEPSSPNHEFIMEPPVIPRVFLRTTHSQQHNAGSPTRITDLFIDHTQRTYSAHSTSNHVEFNASSARFLPMPNDFEHDIFVDRGSHTNSLPGLRLRPRPSSSRQYAFLIGSSDQIL